MTIRDKSKSHSRAVNKAKKAETPIQPEPIPEVIEATDKDVSLLDRIFGVNND